MKALLSEFSERDHRIMLTQIITTLGPTKVLKDLVSAESAYQEELEDFAGDWTPTP